MVGGGGMMKEWRVLVWNLEKGMASIAQKKMCLLFSFCDMWCVAKIQAKEQIQISCSLENVDCNRSIVLASLCLISWTDSSDEDGIKVPKHEVFEERFGEGEEPAAADSQGAEATVINQRVKGKKQQHQRQRTEVKKARKEHEVEHKQVALNAVKDSVVQGGEAEGGRMRRCKQPVAQTALAWRAHQQCPQQQQQQLESKPLSQLPQPLARRRQRRLPRTFSVPKEELEGGLRSLTRYFL